MQSRPLFCCVVQSPYTKVINFMRCVECLGNTYKYSHSPKKQSQTFFDRWGLISKNAVQIFCGFSVALRSPFAGFSSARTQTKPTSHLAKFPERKRGAPALRSRFTPAQPTTPPNITQ